MIDPYDSNNFNTLGEKWLLNALTMRVTLIAHHSAIYVKANRNL
jgi:hypothetical protein